jgi:hypothetical protein
MTDWKSVAQARHLDIPETELERIAAPLDELEETFRPLTDTLTYGVDPAAIFEADEEGE